MSWHRPEQRPIVDWPEGRDWRCTGTLVEPFREGDEVVEELVPCPGVKPESQGGQPFGCPECGGPMSRIVVRL